MQATTGDDAEQDAGCCKGDAPETNDKCNERSEPMLCETDEKCQWVVGSEPDLCVFHAPPTKTSMANTTTSTNGCCYPEKGKIDARKESCPSVHSEKSASKSAFSATTASEETSTDAPWMSVRHKHGHKY